MGLQRDLEVMILRLQNENARLNERIKILDKGLEFYVEANFNVKQSSSNIFEIFENPQSWQPIGTHAKQAREAARNLGLVNFDKKDANQINTTS